MKRIAVLCLCLLLLLLVACKAPEFFGPDNTSPNDGKQAQLDISTCYTQKLAPAAGQTNYVQFEMQGGATFVVELYPEYAPQTVDQFKKLVTEDFYDGLTFHRITGTSLFGGDPNGNGTGFTDTKVEGEFTANGFEQNTLKHTRGTLSLLHGTDPNSGSCQFFITHQDCTSYDGKYAAFGHVIYGMETIDAIANLAVTAQPLSGELSKPIQAPVIQNICFVNIENADANTPKP